MTYRDIGAAEYRAATALDLAREVTGGTLSPVALAELALGLAAEAEPVINAYAFFRREAALREAAALEAEARAGRPRSVLHGVPVAVKDNSYLAGEATFSGSRTASAEPAPVSSPFIGRLVRAGAVVIGKTTTPEFGWKGTGISPRTGVTRNPWDPARGSGGSSSGSGATVASGAVPIATGSDAGGSIRIPASWCGVVGLKPTLSAIPVWPGTANELLSHAGPLTRSVADARAVLELTRGADPRDPQSACPAPLRDPPGARVRVGVVPGPFGITALSGVDRAVQAAVQALRAALPAAGIADLVEAELAMPVPREVFEAMWVTGRGLGYADVIRAHAEIMDPGLVRLLGLAQEYSLADYYAAMTARRAFSAAVCALFEQVDLLVLPTMPRTALPADAEVPSGGEADAKLPWITWTPYTYPFNITGQPAITIPCGFDPDGMPVGLQVVGPWGHDERVLHFAQACERALSGVVTTRVAPRLTSAPHPTPKEG
jgi:aspartyl-tRNA(Asn)/glutamyl-tRNA(Gln) amidotransferase subunit A